MLEKWKLYKEIVFSKQFTEADKIVAFALLDHYNTRIKKVFPTNRRIVTMTGLSYRQVQRSTTKLHHMKVIKKLSKKGKNFYEPDTTWQSPQDDSSVTPTTTALSPPSKPTSLTSNINLNGMLKNLAKKKSIHYHAVVNSGRTYEQNMERKYRKVMPSKLSSDKLNDWIKLLNDPNTKQAAMDYARKLCEIQNG